jgi:hypothetical protein
MHIKAAADSIGSSEALPRILASLDSQSLSALALKSKLIYGETHLYWLSAVELRFFKEGI